MDSRKYMLLVNGQDKSDSVASFRFQDSMCEVIYANSPKAYHYRAEKVQLLKVQSRIDPSDLIIIVDGDTIQQVDEILDFGPFYRFLRTGKKALTYSKGQVELQKNCLKNQKQAGVFEYFKETAAEVSLVAEGGLNILSTQYERIKSVSDATVLSCYLDSSKKPTVQVLPEAVSEPKPENSGGERPFLPSQYHPGASRYRENTDHSEYHLQCGSKWSYGSCCLQQQLCHLECSGKIGEEGSLFPDCFSGEPRQ